MVDQLDNPVEMGNALVVADPKRRPDGTYGPGCNPNPRGAYTQKGQQKRSKRLEYWLDKPFRELMQIQNGEGWELDYSMLDVACIQMAFLMRMAEKERDKITAFNAVFDRIEGKPKETFERVDPDDDIPEDIAGMTDEQVDEAFRNLRTR